MNSKNLVVSTFKEDECVFLLKNLTGLIKEISIEEKEEIINKGISYSEVITKEHPLDEEINNIFKENLLENAEKLAYYVGAIAEEIYRRGGENAVIVSLARAGSPIGALIKRYIIFKYGKNIPHYSISIIRDKGIDEVAMNYIISANPNGVITFVDGWTGKGSITQELKKSIDFYNEKYKTNISSDLAVLADPAKLSKIAGTKKDICIPNACLNSTVSGLISRTIHNKELISDEDFHGATCFEYLKNEDFTNYFLDEIEKYFTLEEKSIYSEIDEDYSSDIISSIIEEFSSSKNKLKLSIGETSRALLRRNPKVILVKNINNPDLSFILYLAKKKNIEVREYDTFDYECISILN